MKRRKEELVEQADLPFAPESVAGALEACKEEEEEEEEMKSVR